MADAVIVDAVRTPIGRALKGSLRALRADDLAAVPLRALLARNPAVAADSIGDVMMGCGYPEGEQGINVGRIAALLAGMGANVPGTTVNRFCASSLQTLRMAFHAIRAGEGDTYIAAGVEAISRATASRAAFSPNPLLDGSPRALCDVYIPMGLTAENVAERCGVTRQAQDEWALTSQTRAVAAQRSGHVSREIVRVTVPAHTETGRVDGEQVAVPEAVVALDDGPRPNTSMQALAALAPVFKPDGTVTAGNACPLNDGAAAVLVMSAARAGELDLRPRARILASSVAALEPELMGLGPVPAIRRLLAASGMTVADIDVFEINEAFAAQVIPCRDQLGIPADRLNPFGGAIALGHPFGMTGARIMTTLLNDLETLDRTYGVESMCVAGGMGMAMLVQRI